MSVRVLVGDARDVLKTLPDASVHCVVTSPPYWNLRDYGVAGQIGLEPTPEDWVADMVAVFSEVRRVLREDGTAWVNVGDAYCGSGKGPTGRNGFQNAEERQGFVGGPLRQPTSTSGPHVPSGWSTRNSANRSLGMVGYKAKDLIGLPWMLAFALRADGWYLRADIIWAKPNPMPESVTDRPTKAHEYVFLLSKSRQYFFDSNAVREGIASVVEPPNRNGKSVILGQHFGLSTPPTARPWPPTRMDNRWLTVNDAVSYASAILQGAKLEGDLSLATLDPEVRHQLCEHANSLLISGAPYVHGATVSESDSTLAYLSAEQFLQQFDGLQVALLNGDVLRIRRRPPEPTEAPLVRSNGNAAIGVDDASGISELQVPFVHHQEYTVTTPTLTARIKRPDGWDTGAGAHGSMHRNGREKGETVDAEVKAGRNIRSVWTIATEAFPEAHFATYPTALVEPCIKAGTSERGCCPECGAPWVREVEKGERQPEPDHRGGVRLAAGQAGNGTIGARFSKLSGQEQAAWRADHPNTTTGWRPSCGHAGEPQPCTVLDPFMGAGTTLLVADRLNRNGIGIEINPVYAEMARRRIADENPMFTSVDVA